MGNVSSQCHKERKWVESRFLFGTMQRFKGRLRLTLNNETLATLKKEKVERRGKMDKRERE